MFGRTGSHQYNTQGEEGVMEDKEEEEQADEEDEEEEEKEVY